MMSLMKVRTNGNASPQGKPRVYVACHPSDVELWFEKICEDIFKAQDCAIYYTSDMSVEIPEENKETDLGRMNLFVIPVTFRLLTTKNRCMDSDFAYAVEKHIPVLPIMMESGIDEFYVKKFGERQYLNPFSRDLTEIGYEEKLKKYLRSVLVDDETAAQIRAAFDAYIFLSYRKKDRRYANELMRLIHSYPLCRDIAVWYDEFLTPGENFNSTIAAALKKSKLFTILVTPNLINEENYVQSTEYPAAKKARKKVLPVEMEKTDTVELAKQFKDIPPTVDVRREKEFRARLMETISKIARASNDSDPAHNFLIGLAYLEGIDVEVDRARGLDLITSAAEAELPEAMLRLAAMYDDGSGVEFNSEESLKWRRRIFDYMVKTFGEKHPNTLIALGNLASAYVKRGDYAKALSLQEKVYSIHLEVLGESHSDTLTSLNNLAQTYHELGDYSKALSLQEKAYNIHRDVFGESDTSTLKYLGNLASIYGRLGDYDKELEYLKTVYTRYREVLGERHRDTLAALNNLATAYSELGDHGKALEFLKQVYTFYKEILGERHPDTLTLMNNLASAYGELGDYDKEFEYQEKAYNLRREVLGERHPATLDSLNNLAYTYGELKDHNKALELQNTAYNLCCEILGENHPHTLISLNNLALIYSKLGDHNKALEFFEKILNIRLEIYGERQPDTLLAFNNVAATYGELGYLDKALEFQEKAYNLCREVLGEKHPGTFTSLKNLASAYLALDDYAKAAEFQEKAFNLSRELLGDNHPETISLMKRLFGIYFALGDIAKAMELQLNFFKKYF